MSSLEQTPYEPYKRYLLEIAYDGGNYRRLADSAHLPCRAGGAPEDFDEDVRRTADPSDRQQPTDAGVHAQRFAASYLTPVRPDIPPDKILRAVNRQLPVDIKLRTVREVPLEFHARYDALGKAYTYVLNLGAPSPFIDRYKLGAVSPHGCREDPRRRAGCLSGRMTIRVSSSSAA